MTPIRPARPGRSHQLLGLLLLPLLGLVMTACSDDPPTGPTVATPTGVVVSIVGGGSPEFVALTQTKQFLATATASDGTTEDATNKVVWQSSNTGVAIVSPAGVVTAVGFGTATINATLFGRTGQLTVTVRNGCLVTLDPPSLVFPAGVYSGRSVTVTVIPSDCRWRAEIDASWVSFHWEPMVSGSTELYYSVPPNDSPGERTARLTITASDGSVATHTIRQPAQTCLLSIDPASISFPREGGSGRFAVSAVPATCRWTASIEWAVAGIRIDSGAAGEGPGAVTYTVSPNTSGYSQSYSILVQGGAMGDSAPVRHYAYLNR